MNPGPGRGYKGARGQTKPCACGRPGCMVVQRDNEHPGSFRDRMTASRSCANRLRARSAEQQAEERIEIGERLGGRRFLARLRACERPADLGHQASLGIPVTIRQELPL